jgi:hypothetical protein
MVWLYGFALKSSGVYLSHPTLPVVETSSGNFDSTGFLNHHEAMNSTTGTVASTHEMMGTNLALGLASG